jgi:hypothetical protein
VQLVSMCWADGLMKIDSNYVDPSFSVRNDDEGCRIQMSGASIVSLYSDVTPETSWVGFLHRTDVSFNPLERKLV